MKRYHKRRIRCAPNDRERPRWARFNRTESFLRRSAAFSFALGIMLAIGGLGTTATAPAQTAETVEVTIQLSPRREPEPALRYRLMLKPQQQKSGNAAVYYGKIKAENNFFFGRRENWNTIQEGLKADAKQVLGMPLAASLAATESSLTYYQHQAALCRDCDWQFPLNETPWADIRLPEIQEARQFSVLSLLAARYQIASGDYPAAIASLQDTFAYGKNVNAEPAFAVSYLVSAYIDTRALEQVEFWIQQPGAPNLYWALASLPDPLLDCRAVLDLEAELLEGTFPFLLEVESEDHSRQYWNEALQQMLETVWYQNHFRYLDQKQSIPLQINKGLQMLLAYSRAKDYLTQVDYPQERLQEMGAAQAILLAGFRQYQQQRDELMKWSYLPSTSASKKAQEAAWLQFKSSSQVWPDLFLTFLPSFSMISSSQLKTQRTISRLRLLEAIRMHGSLPQSLDEIQKVPLPIDPFTGKAWDYRWENGQAILTAPGLYEPGGFGKTVYRLTMTETSTSPTEGHTNDEQ